MGKGGRTLHPLQSDDVDRGPLPRAVASLEEPAFGGPAVFEPEVVKEMSEAFEFAWRVMVASNHIRTTGGLQDETRRQLALTIVELARGGIHDLRRLYLGALRCMFPLELDGQTYRAIDTDLSWERR
jgi:hypothetical protein